MKMVSATADFGNEDRPLEPEFDNRSGRKRTTGPIQFAIDGNDDTAWGINAGPGRRNVPRNAVFVPEKPVSFPNGAYLAFELLPVSRRLEQRRQPEQQYWPVPP